MNSISRRVALEKCIVVFEGIRRAMSKGNAGLEPEKGCEKSFWTDTQILDVLRGMIREMEAGGSAEETKEEKEEKPASLRDWQQEIMEHGPPERMIL